MFIEDTAGVGNGDEGVLGVVDGVVTTDGAIGLVGNETDGVTKFSFESTDDVDGSVGGQGIDDDDFIGEASLSVDGFE